MVKWQPASRPWSPRRKALAWIAGIALPWSGIIGLGALILG